MKKQWNQRRFKGLPSMLPKKPTKHRERQSSFDFENPSPQEPYVPVTKGDTEKE